MAQPPSPGYGCLWVQSFRIVDGNGVGHLRHVMEGAGIASCPVALQVMAGMQQVPSKGQPNHHTTVVTVFLRH